MNTERKKVIFLFSSCLASLISPGKLLVEREEVLSYDERQDL